MDYLLLLQERKMRVFLSCSVWFVILGLLLNGCGQETGSSGQSAGDSGAGLPTVLATTSLVGDVTKNVAGDRMDVQVLVPPGVDEHTFQFAPADVAKTAKADVVFMNGAGLESFMTPLLANIGSSTKVISVSDGIELLKPLTTQAGGEHEEDANATPGDPHVWTDPNLVMVWAKNIAAALAELDPQNADEYQANADRYQKSLQDLDAWIATEVAQIPQADRKLVTDHEMFFYFANRYGLQQVGAVVPSYSTVAEPTAQEMAALEDAIRQLGVKAIFVGNTVNPGLANRVAQDTGVRLVQIYTGSLTDGEPAGTYLDYMRYNVKAIVEALK